MKQPSIILTLLWGVLALNITTAKGQVYSRYNHHSYNPIERVLYRPGINVHSSVRPFRLDEVSIYYNVDSIIRRDLRLRGHQNIFGRFLHSDLFRWNDAQSTIRINPLFNFEAGKDNVADKSWFVNTRGVMVEGNLGAHIGFYMDLLENQATFPGFLDDFVRARDVVPGQGRRKDFGDDGHDYSQSTGYLSYNAGPWFNLQAGYGKNFIGDGYRTLLLSDNAYSYPYFKMTVTWKKLKYMMMVADMKHLERDVTLGDTRYPTKYGAFHYIDWNIGNRVSVGFFESVIWAATDTVGYRGLDYSYLVPFTVLRPVEYALGSPDNITMGINVKVVPWKDAALYGQFVLGEFKQDEVFSGDKWWANKQGFLLGFKTFNLLNIKNLDFQSEYSQVRPYTYSHYQPITNYGHYNQELAHPLGANFRESISFIKYRSGRWHFELMTQFAVKGLDPNDSISYGGNILASNLTRPGDYGHSIGQGLRTTLTQGKLTASYLINPMNNMNLAAGIRYRKTSNDQETLKGSYLFVAFRTSLRNVYYNFL